MSRASASQPTVIRAESMQAEFEVPVVIVGAGAAGLVAAITLRDANIDCVVLERDASPSGSTALSSGFIPAPSTLVQKSLGIDDGVELFASDIMNKTLGTAAPHLVRAYAAAVGPAIDNLQSNHGIEFEVLDGFLYPGHTVRRMHAVRERTGVGLMTHLERAANESGATLVTDALVRELWLTENNKVLGVGYERPDGSMERVACEYLVLACNGFGGNAAMVKELLPEMRDAIFAGHEGNDGSAIAWGRELDAALADLGGYQGHGSWAIPQGALISWAAIMDGGIQINLRGERFHDETHGYSEAAVHVLAQPEAIAWDVFDQPVLDLLRSFPDFCDAEAAGALKTCVDIGALAGVIKCQVEALEKTLGTVSPERADPFGRKFLRPLKAPFFAVKVTGALFHTQGGLDIDAACRVKDKNGKVFAQLYAIGGAARGVSGNAVWGYLSGNGLLSAFAGGHIAGNSIIGATKNRQTSQGQK